MRPFPNTHRLVASLVLLLSVLAAPATPHARDLAVVISEIMYHPPPEHPAGEYLELTNLGPGSVQLDGWTLSGGVSFTFPAGVRVREGSSVVVAENAAWLASYYHLSNVVGSYQGRLDNGGERVVLRNRDGTLMDEVNYDDKPPWPTLADGLGASLELPPGESDNHYPDQWRASLTPGGTPGRPNRVPGPAPLNWLVPPGAEWRYFKGTREPSDPVDAWRQVDFAEESTWSVGPAGFGYGDNDDATVLSDMQNGYRSVYIRHHFQVVSGEAPTRLVLENDYDDGFVAYLNGVEVARSQLGDPGTFVAYNQTASDHEAGVPESFDISAHVGLLQPGDNVLAVQGHNQSIGSSDFSLHPRLRAGRGSYPKPALSEIAAGSGTVLGFVEIYNYHAVALDLSGYALARRMDAPYDYMFPVDASVDAHAYLMVAEDALGVNADAAGANWYLFDRDGDLVDALQAPPEAGWTRIRDPYRPAREYLQLARTPAAPNRVVLPSPRIAFNEIHFHPLSATLETEFIELHNFGAGPADLDGWRLAGGVDFLFLGGPAIPAGGYLVVAASPQLLPASITVEGPWVGKLDNRGENVRLEDAWGNVIEEVRYSREEGFTREADGTGRTLERVHPQLDGDSPQAWAAGPPGGTPGARNGAHHGSPPPTITAVRHAPLFPQAQEPVAVLARIAAVDPIESVVVHYARDGVAEELLAPMQDDGQGADLLADDGVYAALLPPQPDGTRVRFRVIVESQSAARAVYPPDAPASACLYLSGGDPPTDEHPYFRVIMTAADRQELETRPVTSNVLLPCTVIAGGEVRYLCGIRYRGDNARRQANKSYRVDLTGGRPLAGVRKLNLNAYRPYRQVLGADLFRRADVPAPLERYARMSLNGEPAGLFAQVERVDADFLERLYPDDDGGLLYRCNDQADLGDHGGNLAYYRQYYVQRTDEETPDHEALIALTRVFSTTDDAYFESELPRRIDLDEWLRWFAVKTVLNDDEGGLSNYSGDDYLIYRRPSDGRFILIGWDLDSVMQDPYGVIYRQSLASVRRLLRSPAFAARYLRYVVELAASVGAPQELGSRLENFGSGISAGNHASLAEYGLERNSSIHGQLRRHLSVWTAERDVLREILVAQGDVWRFFRGRSEPSGGTTAWTLPGFDDSAWEAGGSGFGYGDGDDHTLLEDMEGDYVSLYIRRVFDVPNREQVTALYLSIDYDDGFVAYLNGVEVARAHVAGAPPAYNTRASDHEAGTPEIFDLSHHLHLLVEGDNVMAIQGHNQSSTSSDFSLIPELHCLRSASGSVRLSDLRPYFDAERRGQRSRRRL
ncbi:lamin tail domain-containing protein [bacterium]|nr:lamin tail domain-containing protein [bacterium]